MRRHHVAHVWAVLVSALAVAVPLAGLIVAATPRTAGASISQYTDPKISYPESITSGPDGALWFTNGVTPWSIGRITTSGVVTKFTDPSISGPDCIAAGPDGALWFTNSANDSIGRITTSGVVTKFTDPSISGPDCIVAGPDGALWFTNLNGSIGRITTSGVVTNFTDATISAPGGITAGPDGALWFTNNTNNSIGRITTAGVVTKFSAPSILEPGDIASGPDGALWFTNGGNDSIGRITTAGVVANFTDPSIDEPGGIASGPDGALWFTNGGVIPGSIGRITTSGTVSNFTDATISRPTGIASGPDGALWFTDDRNNSIGRLGSPKATDTCSVTQTCVAAVGVAASVSSPAQSVMVTGKPDHPPGSVKLTFKKPGSLTCPNVPKTKLPVGSLTDKGYSPKTKLKVTVTLRQAAATSAAQVCYRSPKPFKSQSPSTSKKGGGTGLLLTCKATKYVAPCALSSKPVGTSVVATFVVPGGDPDFSIQWPKGSRQSWLSQFGQGTVGNRYEAQLQVKGGVAPYRWKMTSGKFPKGVTLNAKNGAISGIPNATGKFPVVVQATDAEKPAKKTKPEKVPIVINAAQH